MANKSNYDAFYAKMNEMKGFENESSDRTRRKLTKKERRERFVREHYARQGYRNYGKERASFASVIYQETITTIFGVLVLLTFLAMIVIPIIAFASESVVFGTLLAITAVCLMTLPLLRRIAKRNRFMRKLDKLCKREDLRLYRCENPLRSIFRATGSVDFAVETRDTLYECEFYPAPRKMSVFRFDDPEKCTVVTGISRNRFKVILGLNHDRVRERSYGFEGSRINSKKYKRILLLSPVPYELYCYDATEHRSLPGGSGSEFFGYTAYSATGFIENLKRELDTSSK